MVSIVRSDLDVLEGMIDKYSLSGITEALAHIAAEKAAHIRESYDDAQTAKIWDSAADRLTAVAAKFTV